MPITVPTSLFFSFSSLATANAVRASVSSKNSLLNLIFGDVIVKIIFLKKIQKRRMVKNGVSAEERGKVNELSKTPLRDTRD